MAHYYNENDPKVSKWLKELVEKGFLPYGDVDTRSILDVDAVDLRPYQQCHFFAGIGGWSLALQLAQWPEERLVWTASLPCQPFSGAGRKKREQDERHLWPKFYEIVQQLHPPTIFGEQVSSKAALPWWDNVQSDLENADYAATAFDLCAAGVGAPHLRQRLYWVADSNLHEHNQSQSGSLRKKYHSKKWRKSLRYTGRTTIPYTSDSEGESQPVSETQGFPDNCRVSEASDIPSLPSPWDGVNWIKCRDGQIRPVKPSILPMVDGISSRMGRSSTRPMRLKGYGNAICVPLAAEFISAFLEL